MQEGILERQEANRDLSAEALDFRYTRGSGVRPPQRTSHGLGTPDGLLTMTPKRFRLSADQIQPIAVGYGSCIASDRIVVDCAKVGYCYREPPDNDLDSGWRFFAGDESDDYTANADNFVLDDVNTIANYDPDIVSLIEAPAASAFERDPQGKFVEVDFEPPDD